jgi:hypothetical protein
MGGSWGLPPHILPAKETVPQSDEVIRFLPVMPAEAGISLS